MNDSDHDDEISKGPIEMRFPVVCFVHNKTQGSNNKQAPSAGSICLAFTHFS